METAKTLNYAAFEKTSTALFVLFMASWVVLRITIFPVYIIRSCFFEVQVRCVSFHGSRATCLQVIQLGFYIVIFALLFPAIALPSSACCSATCTRMP